MPQNSNSSNSFCLLLMNPDTSEFCVITSCERLPVVWLIRPDSSCTALVFGSAAAGIFTLAYVCFSVWSLMNTRIRSEQVPQKFKASGFYSRKVRRMCTTTSNDFSFLTVELLTNCNLSLAHFSCAVNHFKREDCRASSVVLIKQCRYATNYSGGGDIHIL